MTNPAWEIIKDIVSIVSALATAGALWVTYLTLREMQKQTDLGNNPLLKLRFKIRNDRNWSTDQILENENQNEPHTTWLSIISNNLHQDLSGLTDNTLFIELKNAGKSEMTKISISVNLEVWMFENGILGFEITPTKYNWNQEFSVDLDENDAAYLPISNVRYFPQFKCQISNIEYSDIRGNKYTLFDGVSSIQQQNEVLRPQVQQVEAGELEVAEIEQEIEGDEEFEPEHREYEPYIEDDDEIPF